MRNIGGPLTLNLVSEILILGSLTDLNLGFTPALFITAFMAVAYSLFLYALLRQGQLSPSACVSPQLQINEILLLVAHAASPIL